MKVSIPAFVDQALREWDFIAFFAYDNFESVGRGVVGLMNTAGKTQVMYGGRDYFLKQKDQQLLQMLDTYDTENEFLVHFDVANGTRTIKIQTPEGGRSPKRIWFFEMLRRLNDAPEELPSALPKWFITTCEKFERVARENAKHDSEAGCEPEPRGG